MITDHVHDQLGKHRIGIIDEIMPDFIKEAEERIVTEDLSKLADGAFAYSDGLNRRFPIHTAEHTWLSHAYFEKFASEIDEQSRGEVGERIHDAFKAFGLPENSMVKIAAQEDEIDALHELSIEMNKFVNNLRSLSIEERRKRAQQILHHAFSLGKHEHVHDSVKRYASNNLNPHYAHAFAKRMQYFHHDTPERKMLLDMQMETPKHVPELVAKALALFDQKQGLHKLYDNELEDPYFGILSHEKQCENDLEFDGHKVAPSKLHNFDYSGLGELLNDEVIEKLKSNPIDTIRSMEPHVRIIVVRRVNA